jgi:NAD(P)-dependent dehydrogenase (short-subunit alcohol dehydrogenase family)
MSTDHAVAVVIGGASGIGWATVQLLTERGDTLVPGLVEEYIDNTPLGRAGTPGDIAQTIGFLTSAAAGWMTGAAIDLNGGAHTKRYPDIVARIADMAGGNSAP